ncbi:MAG: protocatechuate 3,4-dioxygenase subunit alpha [Candidatus Acidiferrum sp.]
MTMADKTARQAIETGHATTWQTIGPFFSIGLQRGYVTEVAGPGVVGERITIEGRVFDGDGLPIPDAVVEIWQANSYGRYAHPEDPQDKPLDRGFLGYARIPTGENGGFAFKTIKPGSVCVPGEKPQAPHLLVGLMMRGLLRRVVTRMYFPNEPLNDTDEILQRVEAARRGTLLLVPDGTKPGVYRWDIHMQGDAETVFFEF